MCKFNTKNRRYKFPKGYTPWNKGLTKETDSRLIRSKEYIESITKKGNPFYGKKHKEESKKKIGNRKYPKGKEHHFFGKHIWEDKEHPKGMLGKENKWGKHTNEEIEKIKKARAKQILPVKDTSIEQKIQNFLTLLHIEYFTHKYIHIEHSYQCDILIPKQETEGVIIPQKTIIECDGCYWHGCPICKNKPHKNLKLQKKKDKLRTKELLENGFRVIRLWGHKINAIELNDFRKKLS